MKQWLNELRASWRDHNFVCAVLGFLFAYCTITVLGFLLPIKLFIAVLAAIAGWQLASWSWELAPKLRSLLKQLKIFR
jgi:membrane protein implicated in regulation of membrane protease activity